MDCVDLAWTHAACVWKRLPSSWLAGCVCGCPWRRYNEEKLYDYGKGEWNWDTGHFTQLVWRRTYLVGCAIGVCPDGVLVSDLPASQPVRASQLPCMHRAVNHWIKH